MNEVHLCEKSWQWLGFRLSKLIVQQTDRKINLYNHLDLKNQQSVTKYVKKKDPADHFGTINHSLVVNAVRISRLSILYYKDLSLF